MVGVNEPFILSAVEGLVLSLTLRLRPEGSGVEGFGVSIVEPLVLSEVEGFIPNMTNIKIMKTMFRKFRMSRKFRMFSSR